MSLFCFHFYRATETRAQNAKVAPASVRGEKEREKPVVVGGVGAAIESSLASLLSLSLSSFLFADATHLETPVPFRARSPIFSRLFLVFAARSPLLFALAPSGV